MTLRRCMTNAPQARRGFTLTEIAIVLGIIGLILGSIWAAASSVYNNLRTSRAQQELLSVAQGIRAMYATQSTMDTLATNDTYINAGVFPSDTIVDSNNIKSAKNPWGGDFTVAANNDNTQFDVVMTLVPMNACITLATSTTGSGRDSGLTELKVGTTGLAPFPVAASKANTNCSSDSTKTLTLTWTFRLRS